PAAYLVSPSAAPAELVLQPGQAQGTVVARIETTYVPAADGSSVAAAAQGFVVSRELLLVKDDGTPPERVALDAPGKSVKLAVGDVVEEHVQIVNPADRHYVAVVVPLAAGVEPMNPNLATAPAEAKPAGQLTSQP